MSRLALARANLRARISAARSKINWRSTFYGTDTRAAELMSGVDRALLAQEIAIGRSVIHAEMRRLRASVEAPA